MGKSSLAAQVVHRPDVRQHFSDGIWWFDAAGMDLRAMCEAVGEAMGTDEIAKATSEDERIRALRNGMGDRKLLLVLDNCEKPADSHRFTEEGYRGTLVTSQHRPTGPKAVPLGQMTDEQCVEIVRASSSRPLEPEEEPALRGIARFVQGNPFAAALAGGQLADAPAQDILSDLERSPWPVLVDTLGKGSALEITLAAAYGRLNPDEQQLFAALGVFGGPSFDLAAVQAVEPSADSVRMDHLVRRSLVRQEEGRYVLHPLVRRYARDRLGESREPYLKMVEYYLGLAQELGDDPSTFGQLEAEVGNALAAMDWCLEAGQWESAARFAVALDEYLDYRGLWGERRRRLEQARAAAEGARDRSLLAICSQNLGIAAQNQGDYDEARRLYQESLAIDEELGNRLGIAQSKHQLGRLAELQGDYDEARRLYQESLAVFQELEHRSGIAKCFQNLGIVAQQQGDYDEARRCYQESLEIKEKLGNRLGIANSKGQLGGLAQEQADYDEARRLYEESLAIFQELKHRSGVAKCLQNLGILAQKQGNRAEARRLYQESLDAFEALGDRGGIAKSKNQLGTLAEEEGDMAAARGLYQEALAILEALGSPDAEIARRNLERLASKEPKDKPKGKPKKKRRPPAP